VEALGDREVSVIRRLIWRGWMPYRGYHREWLVRDITAWLPRRRDWVVEGLIREQFLHLHCLLALA
jgi:hypothetical protein